LREGEDEAFVQSSLVEVVGGFEGVRVGSQEGRAGEENASFDGVDGSGGGRGGGFGRR
jgi:hypothetical protein